MCLRSEHIDEWVLANFPEIIRDEIYIPRIDGVKRIGFQVRNFVFFQVPATIK